jgi:hypothetical protein
MNLPWTKVLGVGVILYALYTIYTGELDMTNKRRYNAPKMIYTRKESPLVFWGFVGVLLVGGVILLFLEF